MGTGLGFRGFIFFKRKNRLVWSTLTEKPLKLPIPFRFTCAQSLTTRGAALKTAQKNLGHLEDLTVAAAVLRHRKWQLHVKKCCKPCINHLGFVMSRLFAPGNEKPRLERDRSHRVSDGPGTEKFAGGQGTCFAFWRSGISREVVERYTLTGSKPPRRLPAFVLVLSDPVTF